MTELAQLTAVQVESWGSQWQRRRINYKNSMASSYRQQSLVVASLTLKAEGGAPAMRDFKPMVRWVKPM